MPCNFITFIGQRPNYRHIITRGVRLNSTIFPVALKTVSRDLSAIQASICGLWGCHTKFVPGTSSLRNPFQTCLATDDCVERCLATDDRVEWRGKVQVHSQTRSLSATRQITLILHITFISVPNFIFVLYCIYLFPSQ